MLLYLFIGGPYVLAAVVLWGGLRLSRTVAGYVAEMHRDLVGRLDGRAPVSGTVLRETDHEPGRVRPGGWSAPPPARTGPEHLSPVPSPRREL